MSFIVHVHIPKTGGTSIQLLLHHNRNLAVYNAAEERDPYGFICAAIQNGFDAVSGHLFHHFDHSRKWTESYFGNFQVDVRLVTVFRNPIKWHAHRIAKIFPNLQTAYILRLVTNGAIDIDRLTEEDAHRAFEILQKRFWYVTTTDCLSKNWSSLCEACEIPPVAPIHVNASGGRVMTDAEIEDVCKRSRADIELYRLVKAKEIRPC